MILSSDSPDIDGHAQAGCQRIAAIGWIVVAPGVNE